MPDEPIFEPRVESRELCQMLARAIEGLGDILHEDPLAPQAVIAAETLMEVAAVALPTIPEGK